MRKKAVHCKFEDRIIRLCEDVVETKATADNV